VTLNAPAIQVFSLIKHLVNVDFNVVDFLILFIHGRLMLAALALQAIRGKTTHV
jgi:hypothetical protein